MGSELLSEEEEPFEVLPGAALGSACIACLYTLFAPEILFKTWKTVDDAVESLHSAKAKAADESKLAEEKAAEWSNSNPELIDGDRVADACKWLSETALNALSRSLQLREACYPTQPASERLAELEIEAAATSVVDSSQIERRRLQAGRAALVLVSEEQRVLADCRKMLLEKHPVNGAEKQAAHRKRKAAAGLV